MNKTQRKTASQTIEKIKPSGSHSKLQAHAARADHVASAAMSHRPRLIEAPDDAMDGRSDATHDLDSRKAAHVDADARMRNLKRLRRIEGQVRGLQKMVEDDRYCADILTQIASVHEALRSVGRELMRNHLKHCATGAIQAGEPHASAMYDELVDMMYKHSR